MNGIALIDSNFRVYTELNIKDIKFYDVNQSPLQVYGVFFDRGDGNVYLIDSREFMKMAEDDGAVDSCHPNDLGFKSMADKLGSALKEISK